MLPRASFNVVTPPASSRALFNMVTASELEKLGRRAGRGLCGVFEKNSGEGGSLRFVWKPVGKVSGSSTCRGLSFGRALLEILSELSDRGCFKAFPPFPTSRVTGMEGWVEGISGFRKEEEITRCDRVRGSLPLPFVEPSIRSSR
jgi:hypothetical protein